MYVDIKEKNIGTRRILRNISFKTERGEMLLILAPSGCGKTTLLKCILGETHYSGCVARNANEKLIYVAQESTLNKRETVYNSLFYTGLLDHPGSSNDEIREEVINLSQRLGLANVLNNEIADLSGGQARRTQLGEGLMRRCNVLMLDEPDSGLDVSTAHFLLTDVRKIISKEHKSCIVVSHNVLPETLHLYDRVLILAPDRNGVASIAFLGPIAKAYRYFSKTSMFDIITAIQPKAKHGEALGNYYIEKYYKIRQS